MKIKTLIIAGILLTANAAKANILAINEMREELKVMSEKKVESDVNLSKAKEENKNLKSSVKDLTKAIKLAVKSNESKQKAERVSVDAVGYSHKRNPYLADMSHAKGQIRLKSQELNR